MTAKTQRDLMAIALNRATGLPDDKRFQESEALIDAVLKENGLALTAADFPPDSLTAGAFSNMMRQVRDADAEKEKVIAERDLANAMHSEASRQRDELAAELARVNLLLAASGPPEAIIARLQASTLRSFAAWIGTVTLVGDPGDVDPAVYPADQRTLRYLAREARKLADQTSPA